jgi:hypothetical protein
MLGGSTGSPRVCSTLPTSSMLVSPTGCLSAAASAILSRAVCGRAGGSRGVGRERGDGTGGGGSVRLCFVSGYRAVSEGAVQKESRWWSGGEDSRASAWRWDCGWMKTMGLVGVCGMPGGVLFGHATDAAAGSCTRKCWSWRDHESPTASTSEGAAEEHLGHATGL